MIDIFSLKRGAKVFHLKKKNYWTVSHVDHKNKRVHLYQVTELKTHKATSAVKYLLKERPIKHLPMDEVKLKPVKPKTKKIPKIELSKPSEYLSDFNNVISILKMIASETKVTNRELLKAYSGQVGIRTMQRITTALCDSGYLIRQNRYYMLVNHHHAWINELQKVA